MLFKAVVLLAALVAVSANDVNFIPCPEGYNAPTRVWSTQCTPDLCTLRRGVPFHARAYFSPRETFTVLNVEISVTLGPFDLEIPIPPGMENACNQLAPGQNCPVQTGGSYIWDAFIPIDDDSILVPTIQVQCKLKFHSEIIFIIFLYFRSARL